MCVAGSQVSDRRAGVCVCVCECPSHFLSTRLQVRPFNGFLQVDSLKDADLRKDVSFGGLDDE